MEIAKTRKFDVEVPDGRGGTCRVRVLDFIQNFLYIRPKPQNMFELEESAPLVLFKLNPQQMELYLKIEDDWCHYRPIRYVILKARQIGFSTLIAAIIFTLTIYDPYKESLVVADIDDHTSRIFQMYQRFYDKLPDSLKLPLVSNKRGSTLVTTIESTVSVETVGEDLGAGSTLKCVHASEFGLWRKQKEALGKIIASVPLTPNTMVFIESTAKGMNYFRDLSISSLNGENKMFKGHFACWYKNGGYRLPYNGEPLVNDAKYGDEIGLFEKYEKDGMTLEGLMWRRAQIDTMGLELFHQEYPTFPDEAFLSTGVCYFNAMKVNEQIEILATRQSTKIKGYFDYSYQWDNQGRRVIVTSKGFVKDSEGNVTIFEKPMPGYPYVIGADTNDNGSDYYTISVRRHDGNCRKKVAKFRIQKMDADQFAFICYCMGTYYNKALVAIEANRGSRANRVLACTGYPKIYVRQNMQRYDDMPANAYGFFTEGSNKEDICSALRSRFREHPEEFTDIEELREMLTFVVLGIGSRGNFMLGAATSTDHDDDVMADAICLAVGETNQQTTHINVAEANKERMPFELRSNEPKKSGGGIWGKSIVS